MKKIIMIVLSLMLVLGIGGYTFAQMGGNMMGGGGMMDQRGMGNMMGGGMMGGSMMGAGQGGGMMQNMIDQCHQMMGHQHDTTAQHHTGTTAQQPSEPLTKDQARERVERYLSSLGNPNLKVGNVGETDIAYEVEVVTKDNSLVNKVVVDKKIGQMRSQY